MQLKAGKLRQRADFIFLFAANTEANKTGQSYTERNLKRLTGYNSTFFPSFRPSRKGSASYKVSLAVSK